MKKYSPYIFGVLGLFLIGMSFFLRNGTAEADSAITNLASSFMIFGGGVCLLVALVTFLKRDDPEEW